MIPSFKPEITELNSRSLPLSDRQGGMFIYGRGSVVFLTLFTSPAGWGVSGYVLSSPSCRVLINILNEPLTLAENRLSTSVLLNTTNARSFVISGHLS